MQVDISMSYAKLHVAMWHVRDFHRELGRSHTPCSLNCIWKGTVKVCKVACHRWAQTHHLHKGPLLPHVSLRQPWDQHS